MKKIRLINRLNWLLIIIIGVIDIILGIIFDFDKRFFYATTLFLSLSGVINLIFILVKEISVLAYDSKRFIPILYVCHVIFGVLGYYLIKYLDGYDKYGYIYWLCLIVLAIIPAIIVYCLEKRNKNKKIGNGPRVMVNKK